MGRREQNDHAEVIAGEETLGRLDEYRCCTAQLSDPRSCNEKQATLISSNRKRTLSKVELTGPDFSEIQIFLIHGDEQ